MNVPVATLEEAEAETDEAVEFGMIVDGIAGKALQYQIVSRDTGSPQL